MSAFTFGATSQAAPQAAGTGTSLFGAPAQSQATASTPNMFAGFGANTQQQQQQQQGQSQQQQQQAPAFGTGSTSLFGAKPATTGFGGSGSLFGAQPNASAGSTGTTAGAGAGGFAFGAGSTLNNNANANSTNQAPSNAFGGTSIFGGQSTANAPASNQNPANSNPNQNQNQQQNQNPSQQQQQQQYQSTIRSTEKTLAERYSDVFAGSGVGSENGKFPETYRLKSYSYNAIRDIAAPNEWDRAMDQATLREAVEGNPDASRLAPVYIVGHAALQARIKSQQDSRTKQAAYIQHISERVNASNSEIHINLEPRRDAASRQLVEIVAHLINLYSRIALMSQLMRSNEVTQAEEDFRTMLDKVVKAFEKTSLGGRLQGRLAEDWGKVMALKAEFESGRLGGRREGRTQFLSDETLIQALDGQTQELAALTHLTKDLKYDSQVVGVLAKQLA